MFSEFENKQDAIREANKKHLANFEKWLAGKELSERTINKHVINVDFYINEYLCYYDALDVLDGCYKIDRFLGDWFIRKAMWSSCSQIKSNAASIKKFYTFMLEGGVVEQKDYDELCGTIKDEMANWLDVLKIQS